MTKRPILRQNVQFYAFSSIFTCSSFETSNFTPKTSNFDIGDHNPNPNPNPNPNLTLTLTLIVVKCPNLDKMCGFLRS